MFHIITYISTEFDGDDSSAFLRGENIDALQNLYFFFGSCSNSHTKS